MVTGLTDAASPYAMCNVAPNCVYLLVCTGGLGRVWSNNRWEKCRAGEAYLCPSQKIQAYTSLTGFRWQFAWAIYRPPQGWHNRLPNQSTRYPCLNGQALHSAIEGLYREMAAVQNVMLRHHWATLINAIWCSLVSTQFHPSRLTLLWEKVDAELSAPWNNHTLAALAGLSMEHLRRLTQAETKRSPMQHVTWLRMRRAELLLLTSSLKIEAIAEAMGYANAYAFSTAFRRWVGCAPSRYALQEKSNLRLSTRDVKKQR
jgi:AraC-like DNA-binding protein